MLFHGQMGYLFYPNPWLTPVAAVTVYSAPDDGRKVRPKHVEF